MHLKWHPIPHILHYVDKHYVCALWALVKCSALYNRKRVSIWDTLSVSVVEASQFLGLLPDVLVERHHEVLKVHLVGQTVSPLLLPLNQLAAGQLLTPHLTRE